MASNLSHGLKQVLSGVMALLIVAGSSSLPANVKGGGLFANYSITASAMDDLSVPQSDSASDGAISYNVVGKSFDVKGQNGLKVTFANNGFQTYFSASTTSLDNAASKKTQVASGGTLQLGKVYTIDNVELRIVAAIINGNTVQVTYDVYNPTDSTQYVKVGSCADTQLGNNDRIPVYVTTSGLRMQDDTNGVLYISLNNRSASGRWVGSYSDRAANIWTSQSVDKTYSGDSGVAWHWDYELAPGESHQFGAYIAAGQYLVVDYDVNGGNALAPAMLSTGANFTPDTPTKTGYTFKGWYTNSDFTGNAYTGGTVTSDMTLYARWQANTYTLTYNANGGSVSPTSKTVTYDSTYGTLPTPTRSGYDFDGWYTAASGGTQVTSSTTYNTTENSTIYAHWSAHNYSYTASGDTITASCGNSSHDTSTFPNQTLKVNAPTSKTYDGNPISAATLTASDNFYSLTKQNTPTIKYVGVSGTNYDSTTPPTNAGSYQAQITVGGKTASAAFTINKANITITQQPQVLAYNDAYFQDKDLTLVTTSLKISGGGTIQYKVGSGNWSTNLPTEKEVGNYDVYYRVVADGNHNDISQTKIGTVNIHNRTLNYNELNVGDLVYRGDIIVPSGSGKKVCTSGSSFGHVDADSYTVTGTYQVTHKGYFGTTYENVSLNPPNLIPATWNVTANTLTYNGRNQALVSVSGNGGQMYYKVNDGAWSKDIPQVTAAGTYTVYWYSVANDIYRPIDSDEHPRSVSVTINQREVGITWGDSIFNYDESTHSPSATATNVVEGDTCNLIKDEASTQVNAGDYTATVIGVSNDNYKLPNSGLTKDFSIRAQLQMGDVLGHLVSVTDNGNELTKTNEIQYIKVGDTVKLTTTGVLSFDPTFHVTSNKNKTNYFYEFTMPEGCNIIKAGHVYDYKLRTNPADDTELLGTDRNDKNAIEELVAKLRADDFEYLADNPITVTVENNAFLTIDDTNTIYTYTANTNNIPLVDKLPVYAGNYTVVAGATIKEATYYLIDNFEITPRVYANHQNEISAVLAEDTFTYSGEEIVPVVTVTDSNSKLENTTLVEGVDYDLSGDLTATNAGNYAITVTFKGNYSGTETLNWTIQPQKLADVTIQPDSNLEYNSEEHLVKIVTVDGSELPKPVEELFKITYGTSADSVNFGKNAPVSAGTYYAFATIKDTNYTLADGTTQQVSEAFTVTPRPVTVTPAEASKTFSEADPTFSCTTTDEIALADNMDFSGKITRQEGENAGTYDYLLENADEDGSLVFGNYKLSIAENSPKFTINKKEVSPTVNVNGEYIYNGQPHEASVTVKDDNAVIDPSQYEVSYDNNVDAGDKAVVTVTAKEDGNYIFTASENFTIKPKSIEGVTIILPDEQYVADGTTEIQPVLTVKDPEIDDTVLEEGKDYTVSYKDNVNANNQAKVTITGMGNYSDNTQASEQFAILSTLDLSAVNDQITHIVCNEDNIALSADGLYHFQTGEDITIYSAGTLGFDITIKDDNETMEGYWYTINIPDGTNKVTATHASDYDIETEDNKAYGYDRNIVNAPRKLLATLCAENIEYLDSLDEKVKITIEESIGVTISGERFEYSPINNGVPLVDGIPVNVGTYKATAKTPINGTNYYLSKQFAIAQRPYSTHTDEIKITVSNDNSPYSGGVIVPEIVITDSKRAENEQTLVRGKDYMLGYYTGSTFVRVDEQNDAEYFGQTAVDSYEIAVQFIGNYTGDATAKWSIAKSSLPLLTITPDENLVFNNETHPVTVTSASALPADNLYTISYQKLDNEEWTDIEDTPVEIGTYRAVLTLTGETDYQFAEEQSTVCQFAVTPKDIDSDDIEVIFQNETMLNPDGWTEPGEITVKDTTTGQTLTENTDYILNLTKTMTAGIFNIEVVGMGNYNGCVMRTWTVYGAKDIECDDIQISYVPTVFLKTDGMTDYEGLVIKDTARNKILEEGADYTVNSNPTQERGKFTLEIMGKGDYTGCALREWMAIAGEEISINSKPELYNIKDNKLRITLTSALAKDDISPIAKIGAIVYRGTEKPAEMTIESAKNNADIYNFSANGNTHSISVRDTEDSVWYVGYVILEDGTIKYDEAKQTSMTALKAETMQFEDTASLYNIKENRLVINITSTGDYPEIISQTGAIVYRGKEKPAEMTIESANSNSTIYNFFDEGDTRSVIVKDTEDSVWYVGYTKYTNGSVRYSEAKRTSMTTLKAQTMQIEDTTALYNLKENRLIINIASTGDYKEIVRKTGAIVYRGQECPEEMTIESANNSTIYNFFDEGDTTSVSVRDTQNSVWYVGYTEYTDGSVKYGELKQTSMNKLLNSKT